MKIINSQNLTMLLFAIPLSFIVGIALTEFFVFFCIIFFLIFNKEKSLFLDKKVIFLLGLDKEYFFLNNHNLSIIVS